MKPSRKLLSQLSEIEARVEALLTDQGRTHFHPVAWAEDRLGFALDQWQRDILTNDHHRLLLVTPRQAGKSTVVAALAASEMVRAGGIRVAVLSPTLRQSGLLSAKVADLLRDEQLVVETATRLVLANGSSLDSLPGDRPTTIRGATADLLLVDEASRVKPELVVAGLPIVAATDGALVMLTTPAGATGAFYSFWSDETDTQWRRMFVTINDVGHYSARTIALMKRKLGPRMFSQEFEGAFLEAPGALFSNADIDALFADRSSLWDGPLGDDQSSEDFEPLF